MKKSRRSLNSNYSLAHVLYQKLGTDWYAFTEVDGDCFMTKVSDDVVAQNHHRVAQESAAAALALENKAKRRAA
jgi:hypothetical protein